MTPEPENVSAHSNRRSWLQWTAGATAAMLATPAQAELEPGTEPVPRMGINLSAVRYYGTERPFNNLFMASSPWISTADGGPWGKGTPPETSIDGWITSVPPDHRVCALLDLGFSHPDTEYVVSFEGNPNHVNIQGSTGLTFEKTQAAQRIQINVTGPVRNIQVREQALSQEPSTFYAPFVERCRRFSVLRFMDWQAINDDRPMVWAERVLPTQASQTLGGVALEHIADLTKLSNTGMWICAHHLADDEYVRQMADLLVSRGPYPGPIYIEHSNEVWNALFPQYKYVNSVGEDWLTYHVARTARIAEIFHEAGLPAIGVLGLQAANLGMATRIVRSGLPDSIQAIAIAPYFGHRIGRGRDPEFDEQIRRGGPPAVIDTCFADLEGVRTTVARYREAMDKLNRDLIAYEGGQHLVAVGSLREDPGFTDLLIAANRHPAMFDVYSDYLQIWNEESGGALMCHYSSVGTPTKFGSWGMLEHERQLTRMAPKYRAILEYNRKVGAKRRKKKTLPA